MKTNLVPISYIVKNYPLTKYVIYSAIQNDGTFPVVKLGPRKNYKVVLAQFETWLATKLSTIVSTGEATFTGESLAQEYYHGSK